MDAVDLRALAGAGDRAVEAGSRKIAVSGDDNDRYVEAATLVFQPVLAHHRQAAGDVAGDDQDVGLDVDRGLPDAISPIERSRRRCPT
ncbi:hypothetical protein [Aureimonas sp. AU4]|uniref:hypothetical protein n=1 Tax=Aureimonas sp. AU4 TaxID=1638163 RepID=UPI000A6DB09E|nr:hypothetical protein [Aureimonas sp. AU4]